VTTTIYICADSTLTYGPRGGRKKIIKAALPVATVQSPQEAEAVIQTVGRRSLDVAEADPYFSLATKGRPIERGYGPTHRYYYSLPEFKRGDIETLEPVRKRLAQIIATLRR